MNQLSISPVKVDAVGTTGSARSLSVVSQACNTTRAMLVTAKGKVGVAARDGFAQEGATKCARACAQGNYRPIAEYLAVELGESVFISGRATYEALPDFIDMRIAAVLSSKSRGMRVKDGVEVEGSKLAKLRVLRSNVVGIMDDARALVEQAKAAAAAAHAPAPQIGNTVEA